MYTQTFFKNWIWCWFALLNWNQLKSRKVKVSLPWPCQPHLQDSGATQPADRAQEGILGAISVPLVTTGLNAKICVTQHLCGTYNVPGIFLGTW